MIEKYKISVTRDQQNKNHHWFLGWPTFKIKTIPATSTLSIYPRNGSFSAKPLILWQYLYSKVYYYHSCKLTSDLLTHFFIITTQLLLFLWHMRSYFSGLWNPSNSNELFIWRIISYEFRNILTNIIDIPIYKKDYVFSHNLTNPLFYE